MEVITPLGFRATVTGGYGPYINVKYEAGSASAVKINTFKAEQLRRIK